MARLLETEKLTIRFGGLAAVNEVDFSIDRGEIVGLIGPNGSGKTTFFNLLTGIYKPTEGEIRYCGESLFRLPTFKIAKMGVARTFQNNRLFLNLTVLDNVLIGMHPHQDSNWFDAIFRRSYVEKEIERGVEKGLELMGQFSEELVSNCYQRAGDLPQADRRKVEICRALASNPKLLLLDEPSEGLAPLIVQNLVEVIGRIQGLGVTILLADQNLKFCRKTSDRGYILEKGVI